MREENLSLCAKYNITAMFYELLDYPYHESVELTGVDLSDVMLRKAARKARKASCKIELLHDDASIMQLVDSNQYDWIISTFPCRIMPDEFQPMSAGQDTRKQSDA